MHRYRRRGLRLSQLRKRYSKLVAYKKVFNSSEGRSVLMDLINSHYVLSSTFDINPYVVAQREGERNVVLRLMKFLKITPADMEKLAEEIEKDARSDSSTDTSSVSRINW